jgi:hypothetical protein
VRKYSPKELKREFRRIRKEIDALGRLIDIDDLLKQIGLEDTEENRENNAGEIITLEDLDRVPAAYDVDKVIQQVKKTISIYDSLEHCIKNSDCADSDCKTCLSQEITAIIQEGGIL